MGDSNDFWGLSTENKEGVGSAVKLSEERARLIQQYLVKQGIDESRMEVKGWGGKKPVYDEDHPAAAANVRVEVEVLRD
jgi:outer membrane protein OmpA-like peptidoglycan-associated protein